MKCNFSEFLTTLSRRTSPRDFYLQPKWSNRDWIYLCVWNNLKKKQTIWLKSFRIVHVRAEQRPLKVGNELGEPHSCPHLLPIEHPEQQRGEPGRAVVPWAEQELKGVSRAEDPDGGAALGEPQRSAEGPLKYRKEPHKSNRGNNPQSLKCWKCLTFPEPQWETLSIKELQVAF